MGCKNDKENTPTKTQNINQLKEDIIENNPHKIGKIFPLCQINIDEVIADFNNISLNSLALAFIKGKTKSFKFLHRDLGASLDKMELVFKSQSIYPLHLISYQGPFDLFFYFIENSSSNFSAQSPDFSFSENAKFFEKIPNIYSYNSVQVLCELGYFHIISCLLNKIKHVSPPYQFDIAAVNQVTGENCALISCKTGNYVLLKFLYENQANFDRKNNKGENALQILCSWHRKIGFPEFYECFAFLVNTVKVDISYNYEETLLLLDDENLVLSFEEKLRDKKIFVKKKDIEKSAGLKNDYLRRLTEVYENNEESPNKEIEFSIRANYISN